MALTPELDELMNRIRQFRDERDWDQFHSVKNLSAALTVEAAEVLELTQWHTSDKSIDIQHDSILRGKFESEIADVFIYLLLLCDKMKINPIKSAHKKIISNEQRYPISKAKGVSTKYSDL
jgi:dCTP diphosphatase